MAISQGDKKFFKQKVSLPYILLLHEVQELYRYEADLLDFRQFSAWLDLLTEDIHYFMPIAYNVKYGHWDMEYSKPGTDMAWFDEGKITLTARVRQIETGIHWAEEPSSRVSHIISNVRIVDARPSVEEAEELDTTSRFFMYRNRLETEQDFMVGKRLDMLRKVDGEWKIAKRTVLLDQNVLLAKNLTLFF